MREILLIILVIIVIYTIYKCKEKPKQATNNTNNNTNNDVLSTFTLEEYTENTYQIFKHDNLLNETISMLNTQCKCDLSEDVKKFVKIFDNTDFIYDIYDNIEDEKNYHTSMKLFALKEWSYYITDINSYEKCKFLIEKNVNFHNLNSWKNFVFNQDFKN